MLAAALAVLLIPAVLIVGSRTVHPGPTPAAPTGALAYIQLGVDRDGSSLRVRWDRTDSMLRDATRAVLHVQDGEIQVDRILTASELIAGSVGYEPKNSDLAFRLDVYSTAPRATGSVQVVNLPVKAEIQPAPIAEPRAQPQARRAAAALPPSIPPAASVESFAAEPIAKTPDTGKTADPPDKLEMKTPVAPDLPEPKTSEKSPPSRVTVASERAVPVSNIPIPNGGPSVSISAEPVIGSKLGRVVRKVPLLRRLKSHDEAAGPVPVYQAQPSLTLQNRQHITQPASVDVKVDVAESGKVSSAEIVDYGEPPNFSLANAALAAARQWTFQPARTEDLPVSSQVILHFHFAP